jgi:exodeoxyribonuclease VII large subunit
MNEIFSVGQLNHYIDDMVKQDMMLQRVNVRGEVSNYKYHQASGHIYFTIKDETTSIRAVMFSGYQKTGLHFPMKNGDKVIVSGSVRVYDRDGSCQVYAKMIEPEGEGELYRRFEALKRELEEMGMFAAEYKRPIPKYAHTIGVVTSATGAVIRDIQNVATRRNPYVQIILYPALVQGEGAAQTIVNGIRALEEQHVDVIIVGRGGGSIENLWAFNEEIVARAIFDSSVPIISAVGHETDFTIADFVADRRAPTPSAAAELAVYDYRQTKQEILAWQEQLAKAMQRKVDLARARLDQQRLRLGYLSPQNRLNEKRRQLLDYEERLEASMNTQLVEAKHQLALLAARLDGASPLKKLSGGYAYVENEQGEALRSVAQTKPEDPVRIHLMDGTLDATVNKVVQGNSVATELELGS